MFNLNKITKTNIKKMKPYSSARDEFTGKAKVWLDANENPFDSDWNRYPDPHHTKIKKALEKLKGVHSNQIFIGNGSDEAIDLLFRAFCEPGKDKAYIFPPTYGMYSVSASINNIEVVAHKLDKHFQLPLVETFAPFQTNGLLFICSPNNPTGNIIDAEAILSYTKKFKGIVVVDEAYIDFAETNSMVNYINEVPNLVVLQTFSKAWGLAGLRVGMAYAQENIIAILHKIKPPYNVNAFSQQAVLKAINDKASYKKQLKSLKEERQKLRESLSDLACVNFIYPSQANFLLVKFKEAKRIFEQLKEAGIIIRNRTKQVNNCLRITVGTAEQNQLLLNALKALDL